MFISKVHSLNRVFTGDVSAAFSNDDQLALFAAFNGKYLKGTLCKVTPSYRSSVFLDRMNVANAIQLEPYIGSLMYMMYMLKVWCSLQPLAIGGWSLIVKNRVQLDIHLLMIYLMSALYCILSVICFAVGSRSHDISGEPKVHTSRPGGQELFSRGEAGRQGRGLWPCQVGTLCLHL